MSGGQRSKGKKRKGRRPPPRNNREARALTRHTADSKPHYQRPTKRCPFSSKLKYGDEAHATAAIERAAALKSLGLHKGKVPVRAYVCPDCNSWHITSMRNWNE